MQLFTDFIHKSKYSRYLDEFSRRETWEETVDRYTNFLRSRFNDNVLPNETLQEIKNAVLNFEVMPSMRLLMTAGPAVERDNVASFNCSFVAVDHPRAFDEIIYILMCGTGVGFSCERQDIAKLPVVAEQFFDTETVIRVQDSKIGWAKAYRELIALLYSGQVPLYDLSALRPKGARLKTFGGRSSGPAPLRELFEFTIHTFKNAAGRKLNSLEVHDIVCKIGSVVVSGGVRRCLPENSMVHTQYGLVPIQNIEPGTQVLTSQGYRPVKNVFDQGVQSLVRVKTQDGFFDCTANHKVAVLTGLDSYEWVKASDLKKDDRLIAPSHHIDGEDVTYLPKFSYTKPTHSTTCRDVVIPTILTEELAWFFGLFQGDGYVRLTSKSGELSLPFPHDSEGYEIANRARDVLESFGVNVRTHSYENYSVLRVKSKQLAAYFHSWLKQPKTPLTVPEFMWTASPRLKMAYISGLMDADGSVKTRPIQIVCSVYPEYVKAIQVLMSSCGYQARFKVFSEPADKSWQRKFALTAINNHTKLGLNSACGVKQCVISDVEQNTNTFPREFLDEAYSVDKPYTKVNSKFIPVKVVSVSDAGYEAPTYDIEVEDVHEFFCEGYLVHNSALISLSNLSDDRLRHAKTGDWWNTQPQRQLSNNSAAYTEKPDMQQFMEEWLSLFLSKSGERGIFNRQAAHKKCQEINRKWKEKSGEPISFGTNPCGEIILRSAQFCNLTEIVARHGDTEEDLARKARIATIMGTLQSTLTDFQYLRKKWKDNTDEERLLGVSITGIMDCPLLNHVSDEVADRLTALRNLTWEVNAEWANRLGIPASAAITCVKPSGTVSSLVNSASGIHPRFAKYYIRRAQSDIKDPITGFMIEKGFPYEPYEHNKDLMCFAFPMKAPENAVTTADLTAIDALEIWRQYRTFWTDHNPSVTINLQDNEWMEAGAWVYRHFDEIGGTSFFPADPLGTVYKQAVFEPITEDQYNELLAKMPVDVDWTQMIEETDTTTSSQELACVGGACEIS